MAQLDSKKFDTHITSNHKWFDLKLGEVWKYRDLIWLFTKRSFVLTYKQTVLGPAWIFINPILTSIVYNFIFGTVAGMSTDGIPQLLFYLTSTSLWTFFAASVTKNATTFTANAGVFGKVYFPRLTTPISNILSSIIQFGIQMILVIVLLIYYVIRGEVSPNWFAFGLIPLVLVQLGIMGMGFGLVVSSLTTKYRDLTVLVTFGVSLWMYATPVVYPLSQLGDGLMKTILMINPVTSPIEIFRYAILGQGTIEPLYVIISVVFAVLVMLFGIMIFNKVERNFMDTV